VNSLRNRLRDGDPMLREPGLTTEDALRIREALRSAPRPGKTRRSMGMAVAVVLLGASAGFSWLARTTPPPVAREVESPRQRQLQFSLPGGTRVIWFFNSDLEVR
jgi:hypothetical protein